MRIACCILFAICLAVSVTAQKVYFIYLQTDNNTPFYVKMGDKIYSSATSGYLILSGLPDSIYRFSIGFPSDGRESRFSVQLSGKDRGLLIKRSESGPVLSDLQTSSIIRPQADESEKGISYQRRNDDFTLLLSKAANDSSLVFAPAAVKEEVAVQKETVKTPEVNPRLGDEPVKTDSAVLKPSQTELAEIKKQGPPVEISINGDTKNNIVDSATVRQEDQRPAADTPSVLKDVEVYKRSVVKKHSESSTSEGFGLVFYDRYEGGADTIRLLIPNPRIALKQSDTAQADDMGLLDLRKDSFQKRAASENIKVTIKSPCAATASDKDFLKLRKNMAARTSDEAMVDEAKKYFRSRCFSTEQIKNLGTLFLTSAGKYRFFDAAYLYVTDRDQFPTLQSELKDDYYSKRFKVLVGE
jgi:hypothetical protein